jgi:hypothetical protein
MSAVLSLCSCVYALSQRSDLEDVKKVGVRQKGPIKLNARQLTTRNPLPLGSGADAQQGSEEGAVQLAMASSEAAVL